MVEARHLTRVIVRKALTGLDAVEVNRLCHEFYRGRGEKYPARNDEVDWYVAEIDRNIVGCFSVYDDGLLRLRWVLDFFTSDWRNRHEIGQAMLDWIESESKDFTVQGIVRVESTQMNRALASRGLSGGPRWRHSANVFILEQ